MNKILNKMFLFILGLHIGIYFIYLFIIFLFGGGGHGSYVPVAVLGAWSGLIFILNPNGITFFVFPAIQMFAYAMFWMFAVYKRIWWRKFIFLPIFHFLGSVIASLYLEDTDLKAGLAFIAYSVATVLCIGYWLIYFIMLKKSVIVSRS